MISPSLHRRSDKDWASVCQTLSSGAGLCREMFNKQLLFSGLEVSWLENSAAKLWSTRTRVKKLKMKAIKTEHSRSMGCSLGFLSYLFVVILCWCSNK